MNELGAANILGQMYRAGTLQKKAAVMVHLFGIQYAAELEGLDLALVCNYAGIPESYQYEIRKGRRLAEFVELKP